MKKRARASAPPELSPWQVQVLEAAAKAPLGKEATFGGATALSVVHLHHRRSQDVDLFLQREPESGDLQPLARALRRGGYGVELRAQPLRLMLVVLESGEEVGHVDLVHYPYDPVDRATVWKGLRADSLSDHAVNKVQALLTRARERDFVDLYFLLREGPLRDLEELLSLARAKFDVGASRFTLAERLLGAEEIEDLPEMLRPITLKQLQRFFADLARALIRKGP